MKKIFSNINQYFLLSQAGLRHDMAKRIMYSTIPSLMDRRELSANLFFHGVEDPSTVDLAIEGWKDIVKYGTEACVKELRHSERNQNSKEKPYYIALSALENNNDYETALDICIEDFSKKWQRLYGGEAWRKIASQLKEILTIGNQIKADPKNTKLKSQMIIALNVFDGLAHNTASIMKNLTQIESKKNNDLEYEEEAIKEYKRILQLMDAKELKDPINVYQEIEPELEAIEPFYFRDWKTKARSNPGNRRNMKPEDAIANREKVNTEKNLIRYKKIFNSEIKEFNKLLNKLKENISVLEEKLNLFIDKSKESHKEDFGFALRELTLDIKTNYGRAKALIASIKGRIFLMSGIGNQVKEESENVTNKFLDINNSLRDEIFATEANISKKYKEFEKATAKYIDDVNHIFASKYTDEVFSNIISTTQFSIKTLNEIKDIAHNAEKSINKFLI